jgi:transcriptional regulator with XRE-family HTH domain
MARTRAAERGIFSIASLHKMLQPLDITISESQFGKVLRNRTTSYDRDLLAALCKVLDVSIDQLLEVREANHATCPTARMARPRKGDTNPNSRETNSHDAHQHDSTPVPPTLAPLPKRT